jgi:outer membrane cobalamin receptor
MGRPTDPVRFEGQADRVNSRRATVISALVCLAVMAIIAVACPAGAQAEESTGAIEGTVLRGDRGTPLEGVEVKVIETGARARTDSRGRFVISGVPAGSYALEVRHRSYAVTTLERVAVKPFEVTEVRAMLDRLPTFLDEVVVSPSRYTLYREHPEVRTSLSREEVQRMPRLADDTFRALERIPGTTGEELSAQVNIRGGEVNEVLVLVDGVEIYDGFHLKDLFNMFSIVDSQAIGGLELMTGSFPVEHGNRMSGVVDISSSTPLEEGRATVGLSTTNLGFLSEGQFSGGRGQWLVCARRTFLDTVIEWVDPGNGLEPEFYDAIAKVQYSLGDRSVLSANLLAAFDDVYYVEYDDEGTETEEELNSSTDDFYAWLNLKTSWTPALYSHTALFHGEVNREREGWVEYYWYDGDVSDVRSLEVLGLTQDWSYVVSDRQVLRWGIDLRRMESSYDYQSRSEVRDPLYTGGSPDTTIRDIQLFPEGNQYGVYIADRLRLTEPLVVEIGVRWDRQTWADDEQVSPRVNLAYSLSDRTTLRAAWGRYYQPQYPYELQVQDGMTDFFPAQRAEHVLVGVEHDLPRGYHVRVEAYHKDLSDLRPHFENQLNPIEIFPEIEPDRVMVAPERAEADGIEFVVKKTGRGPWSWLFGYAYAKAEDWIDDEWVPRSWDQPHTVNLTVNYKPSRKWNINLAGVYHTGWPTTAIEAQVHFNPDGTRWIDVWLGPRNRERFDDYLRLDLRASRSFSFGRGSATVFFEVLNLLNRENVARFEDASYIIRPDGSLEITPEYETWMPIIPTIGVRWEF